MADDREELEPRPDQAGEASSVRRRRPLLVGAVAALAVTAVCAAVFGGLWLSTTKSTDVQYSQARDTVVRVGSTAAVNFTSLDYRHLDKYKRQIKASTIGKLHDSLDKSFSQYSKQLEQNQLKVSPSVQQAAVTALDTHDKTASVLVVLKTVTTSKGNKPVTRRMPMTLALRKPGSEWKVSAVGGNASSAIPGQ